MKPTHNQLLQTAIWQVYDWSVKQDWTGKTPEERKKEEGKRSHQLFLELCKQYDI